RQQRRVIGGVLDAGQAPAIGDLDVRACLAQAALDIDGKGLAEIGEHDRIADDAQTPGRTVGALAVLQRLRAEIGLPDAEHDLWCIDDVAAHWTITRVRGLLLLGGDRPDAYARATGQREQHQRHGGRLHGSSPSLKSLSAFVRPILRRSASLIAQESNQIAAWSTFSDGQSVENMMRSAPISSMAHTRLGVSEFPQVVRWKLRWK